MSIRKGWLSISKECLYAYIHWLCTMKEWLSISKECLYAYIHWLCTMKEWLYTLRPKKKKKYDTWWQWFRCLDGNSNVNFRVSITYDKTGQCTNAISIVAIYGYGHGAFARTIFHRRTVDTELNRNGIKALITLSYYNIYGLQ